MKTKKNFKKLFLKKETISRLDNESLQEMKINMKNVMAMGLLFTCSTETCDENIIYFPTCFG